MIMVTLDDGRGVVGLMVVAQTGVANICIQYNTVQYHVISYYNLIRSPITFPQNKEV